MIDKIKVDGQEYVVDDFEGRELVEVERAFNINFVRELDEVSMTGIYALLFLVKRRSNPKFTPADALALNIGQVMKMVGDQEDEEEKPSGPPPARAAKGAKKPA